MMKSYKTKSPLKKGCLLKPLDKKKYKKKLDLSKIKPIRFKSAKKL